ncbi:MAG: LPS-assembly protein LptD [Bdellovibrionales bacterium]
MIWIRILLFTWMFLVGARALAQASADGVLINADSMERDLNKRVVKLEGHVQVMFQGQHLSCDSATIDLKAQRITAVGNVIMQSEKIYIEGDRIDFNYRQNTGTIYNGFVQSGQVVFEGSVVEKTDVNRYIATNGKYTACETCPPGWSFTGKRIDAEIGGYARIRRPVFYIGGVPILILPGIIVPLKSARQSGFLVPTMDLTKKGGVALTESYFWAIDRSRDLTFAGTWADKRGVKGLADYRYVLAENSAGNLRSSLSTDRAFERTLRDLNSDAKPNRWFVAYNHYFDMPDDYVQRADLNLVSDLRYPREFPKELKGHGDPSLLNRVSISRAKENHFLSAEATMNTNLLKTFPLSDNADAVHRIPELKYSVKEQELFEDGPLFKLDTDFVSFVREKHNYDDLAKGAPISPGVGTNGEIPRDGVFDPNNDLFRTGQRLDIKPTLSYPFQIYKKFEVTPSLAFRETQYRFYPTDNAEDNGFSPVAARRYLQTDLSFKTEFTRVFGDLKDPRSNRWKHAIEPELRYAQIPWAKYPNHPFFGPYEGLQYSRQYEPVTDADVTNSNTKLQFDYNDRTYFKQVVDFGLTNRFTRKSWLNNSPDYRTAVLLRLSQSYDFREATSPTPHPWSSINALLDARFEHFETNTTASYNGYAKVTNWSSRVRFMANSKNYFQVNYTRNFILSDDYVVTDQTRNIGFGAGVKIPYLEASGQVDFLAQTFAVQSWTYKIILRPPGNCWSIGFEHVQVVGSDDPNIHASFGFDFGGEGGKSTGATF